MSSHNISIADRSTSNNSYEVLSNKETQTSTPYITDSFALVKGPSRPLPKGIDKSEVETTVNILDCKVIKDPSETGTADFTESFIKEIENSKLSISDSSTSSIKHNQENILPYLKPHLSRCEDNVDSLERLIQGALADKPCFEIYTGKKDIEDKISKSEVKTMDTPPKQKHSRDDLNKSSLSTKNCKKISDSKATPLPSSRTSTCTINKSAKNSSIPNLAAAEESEDKEIKSSLSRESIAKCVKESFTALKRSASSCLEKIEIVIGIKKPENPDEKPTYYAMEKPKVKCSASNNVQTETGNSLNSIKNLFNNHQEKITNIKETVKNIADKFYTRSKDAVTLIASESAKLLTKHKTEENSEHSVENKSEKKKRKSPNENTNSLTNLIFQRAESKPVKELDSQNMKVCDANQSMEKPQRKEAITGPSKISDSLPPSVRAFKPHICKIRDDIVAAKFEKSSPYDTPVPKEVSNKLPESPEPRMPTVSAIDHIPDPPAPNMFTIIKSKIFSMFRDESENIEPVAQETTPQVEEEEDPFERFMDQ